MDSITPIIKGTRTDIINTSKSISYADMIKKPNPIIIATSPPKGDDRYVTLTKKK
jgi:hypothetical protein